MPWGRSPTPGQALGYQVGKWKDLELRARTEAPLGESFDLRAFHDALPGDGALPMAVLEAHIDGWIEQMAG